jgi:hypothetical protein
MLLILWAAGVLPAFFLWSYIKSKSDATFKRDPTIIENPPYFLGMLTAWAWPLQSVFVTLWLAWKIASNAGEGHGIAIDAQKKDLKKIASEFSEYKKETDKVLLSITGTSDPDKALDLSRSQLQSLTARSIESALTDESIQRNEDRRIKREAGMDFLRREAIKLKEHGILDQEDDPYPLPSPEIIGFDGLTINTREKEIA